MQKVLFDPGYSNCLLGVSENVEFIYAAFSSAIMPMKQKKFQFSILLPRLKKLTTQNVSFYLGCLLWASYIKDIKDGIIENNPCFGMEYNEKEATEETDFLIDFIENKLVNDVKRYLNKPYEIDYKLINILNTYNYFIKLNKGFIEAKETKDIVLPKNIKKLDEEKRATIKNKIDEAINSKDLMKLFDVYDLILD